MGELKQEVIAELGRMVVDDESADTARRLISTFQAWETIRDYAGKERKRCSEKVAARLAQFKEAMEVGHASEADQLLKLSVVEVRWQDLDEARTERKEVVSALRDQIKGTEQKIRDLLAEAKSGQLPLFESSASTVDRAPVPEEDDDEDPFTPDEDTNDNPTE